MSDEEKKKTELELVSGILIRTETYTTPERTKPEMSMLCSEIHTGRKGQVSHTSEL